MLRVYGRKTSSNVQKVMWAVAELKLPHERIDLGGPFGGLDTPEYGKLNPNRLVPTIDDDGFVLWESQPIVRYFAEKYGRGTLSPDGRHAYARADQWSEWGSTTLAPDIIGVCFLGLIRTAAKDRDVAKIHAAAESAARKLSILDRHLEGRDWIVGDTLTFADILVGTMMYRYYNLDIERPRLGNVLAWYQRLTARKAYQEHVMIDFQAMKVPGA
jgi:glutathione S-transferase